MSRAAAIKFYNTFVERKYHVYFLRPGFSLRSLFGVSKINAFALTLSRVHLQISKVGWSNR